MSGKASIRITGVVLMGLTLVFFIANRAAAPASASSKARGPETLSLIYDGGLAYDDPLAPSVSHTAVSRSLRATLPQQGAQEDKPVEQTFKNIKVLNGLPSSKLYPVMNFFSASLGVGCAYCHVRNGEKWDFVSDTKEEKENARGMIKMVLSVNKESFNNNPAISCYTCHRGQVRVVGLPPLPVPPRERPAAEGPARPDAQLPTAEQVFDKYTQAIGGRAAFDRFKTRVWRGVVTTSGGTSMPYELLQAAPDKFLSTMSTPQQGNFTTGYNGTTGWTQNSRGLRILSSGEVAQLKGIAAFLGGNLKEQYTKPRVVGKEKIGEREAYVVRAVSATGNNERLYFDTQTGLLLRRLSIERTMLVNIPEQTDFDDYRDVDGVKLPFTIKVYGVDPFNSITRTFKEVRHNVPVDDAKFNPPPAAAAQPRPAGAKP